MKSAVTIALTCLATLVPLATPSHADEWDKKTKVTFSAPVEVPGRVLSPGTYIFKLPNLQADRHIVEIYNQDETKLITSVTVVPDERLQARGKTIITFEERAKTSPEAVRAWFYPGDTIGEEFVYSESRARELAKSSGQHVLSRRDGSDNYTDIKAVQPSGDVVNLNQVHSH